MNKFKLNLFDDNQKLFAFEVERFLWSMLMNISRQTRKTLTRKILGNIPIDALKKYFLGISKRKLLSIEEKKVYKKNNTLCIY